MGRLITATEVAENPLYRSLDFTGRNIHYSAHYLRDQIARDLRYASHHDGNLPDNGFTNFLRWRWLQAAETGHENRFAIYHGLRITRALDRDFDNHLVVPVHPVTGPQNPLPPIVGFQPTPPVPPPPQSDHPVFQPPPPPPPPCHHHEGSVPEPASAVLLGISIVSAALIGWLYTRRKT